MPFLRVPVWVYKDKLGGSWVQSMWRCWLSHTSLALSVSRSGIPSMSWPCSPVKTSRSSFICWSISTGLLVVLLQCRASSFLVSHSCSFPRPVTPSFVALVFYLHGLRSPVLIPCVEPLKKKRLVVTSMELVPKKKVKDEVLKKNSLQMSQKL